MSLIRRTVRALAPALVLVALTARAAAADVTDIARLAPKRTFLAISIPDFASLRAAFEKSDLGALWTEPGVRAFVEEMTRDQTKQVGDFLQETGIKLDDLKPPTGAVGIAMFLPEPDQNAAPDPGTRRPPPPPPELLVVADMGENAGALQEALDQLIDRGIKDKKVTTEEDTYASARIIKIKPVIDESKKKPADPRGGENPDAQGDRDVAQPSGMDALLEGPLADRKQINLARAGASFLLSTDLKALEAALDAVDGKAGDTLADADDYRDSLGQHPGGELAHGVLLTGPLLGMMAQDLAADAPGGDAASFNGVLDALGISAVKSLSMGLRLDTPDGMLEMSGAVLVPEKNGLIALFTPPGAPFDPPGFVPPDAADVRRLSFRFDGVFDVLRAVAAALPEPPREQFTAGLDQTANIVKPALDTAGPILHSFTTYKQPLADDGEQATIAIDVRDPATVSNTLVFIAGQGLFEPRDFEGNTIYSSQLVQVALGLGFNRLFVGPEAGVENAMRLAGRADAPRLGAEPAFKEAARLLADDAVFAQFSDIRQYVRWIYWDAQNQRKLLEDAPLPERHKAEMLESLNWVEKLPPLQTVLSHLGNIVSDMRATPDGFRGRTVMLRPAADAK